MTCIVDMQRCGVNGVPKQIASVLVGFRTRPLWMNQLWREETHHWRLQRLLDKDDGERKTKSCVSSAYCC